MLICIIIILLLVIAYLVFENHKLRKQLKKIEIKNSSSFVNPNLDPKLMEKYQSILNNSPKFIDFFGREFHSSKYDDSYDTGTNFKLRELFLLVWWGKYKSGRKVDSKIPNYFFERYNLNAEKVTDKFKEEKLLVEADGRYHLSEEGRKIADFYKDLPEIDRIKYFPMNIDEDFPRWNNGKLMIEFYRKDINYRKARIETNNQLIWFYQSYPKFFKDEVARKSKTDLCQNLVKSLQQDIKQDKDKIEALE